MSQIVQTVTALANTGLRSGSLAVAISTWKRQREERFLDDVSQESGLSVEDIVQRITENKVLLETLMRAMEAASQTEQAARTAGLRRAVARALTSDEQATVMRSHMIVRTFAELDTPH